MLRINWCLKNANMLMSLIIDRWCSSARGGGFSVILSWQVWSLAADHVVCVSSQDLYCYCVDDTAQRRAVPFCVVTCWVQHCWPICVLGTVINVIIVFSACSYQTTHYTEHSCTATSAVSISTRSAVRKKLVHKYRNRGISFSGSYREDTNDSSELIKHIGLNKFCKFGIFTDPFGRKQFR